MKKLIINCDDFGISNGVNYAIQDLHRHGILTSATLLVNGPAIEHAIEIARDNSKLGVGIHLSLTMFKPCTNLLSICDENGNMNRKQELYDGLKINTELIYEEFKAQIEKFIKIMGKKPTHIDSHHHVHQIAYISPIVVSLANEYNIPLRSLKNTCGRVAFSMNFYGENTCIDFFEKELKNLLLEEGVIAYEFSCHVGYIDEVLKEVTSYNENRSIEMKTLMDEKIKKIIAENNIQLINFEQIS